MGEEENKQIVGSTNVFISQHAFTGLAIIFVMETNIKM